MLSCKVKIFLGVDGTHLNSTHWIRAGIFTSIMPIIQSETKIDLWYSSNYIYTLHAIQSINSKLKMWKSALRCSYVYCYCSVWEYKCLIMLAKPTELNVIDLNRGGVSQGEDAQIDKAQTKIRQKICQNEEQRNLFWSVFSYFLSFVVWVNSSVFSAFPFFWYTGMMTASFILTLLPWLSDVLFKSVLIFSFAWLHYEKSLSTLGKRKRGEQCGRVSPIHPRPTHLSPSSLLPHQTFVIEPEISGWAALMPGAY